VQTLETLPVKSWPVDRNHTNEAYDDRRWPADDVIQPHPTVDMLHTSTQLIDFDDLCCLNYHTT